jgi:ubiquinone/menaquinone biosynthesis C-methylase UbiE
MDLSERLLAELGRRHGGLLLVAGEGDHLPFPGGRIDAVTAYGVLHHLVEHGALFREVARVLRPGGAFYTDHDPNYYLGRFYRVLYRLRYRNSHGFGDRVTDLSEYHHSQTAGLMADRLAAELRTAGFCSVEVRYRMTTSAGLSRLYRAIRAALRAAAAVYPARSFYTHFYMLARRAH